MRTVVAALLVLLLGCGGAWAVTHGRVNRVYDGDTIRVTGVGKVRLLGIDTPEHEDSHRDDYYLRRGIERKTLRRIAHDATAFTRRLVKGHTVRLEFDREQRDVYGRRLAYVYLDDDRMLNRLLLENGLAAVYRRFDFRYKRDFLRTEKTARDRRRGLWHKGPDLNPNRTK